MGTLTAANSQFSLAIPGVYNAPQTLQGYATDDAFSTGEVTNAEVQVGVDGQVSAGFVFNLIEMTITLQPTSKSIPVFNNWSLAQQGIKEVLPATGSISIPSIGFKWAGTDGYLTRAAVIPNVKKILQPVNYTITWGTLTGAQTA